MATGRSDYPNQINNVLCFPGFFRGLLDAHATTVNEEMKIAAAEAIAAQVPERELHEEYIIPSVFNRHVARAVARAVSDAAYRTGAAVRQRRGQTPNLWGGVETAMIRSCRSGRQAGVRSPLTFRFTGTILFAA